MQAAEKSLARPLRVLVPLIKEELSAISAAGLEHKAHAGEMLIEARSQCTVGQWPAWLRKNFRLSRSTADDYMRLAKFGDVSEFRTLAEVARPNRDSQPARSWQGPVREIAAKVSVEALAREQRDREAEKRLMRLLASRLVDIGYRVLAAKLHPDKGGSHEAMKRLNEVRRILKEAI